MIYNLIYKYMIYDDICIEFTGNSRRMEFPLRSPLRRPNERCRLGRCPCPPVCFVTVGWEIGPKKQLGTWWLHFFWGWLWYLWALYPESLILIISWLLYLIISLIIATTARLDADSHEAFSPFKVWILHLREWGVMHHLWASVPVSFGCRSGKPKLFVTMPEKRRISTGDVFFFATHILRPTSPVEEPGFLSS